MPAVFSTHFEDTGLFAKGSTVNAQFEDTVLYTAGMATYGAEGSVRPIMIRLGYNGPRLPCSATITTTSARQVGDVSGRTEPGVAGGEGLLPGAECLQRRDMLRNKNRYPTTQTTCKCTTASYRKARPLTKAARRLAQGHADRRGRGHRRREAAEAND